MSYVDTMRAVLLGDDKSFVVFAGGTIVISVRPPRDVDLASAARDLLKEWGPVHAGSPSGDFGTTVLPDGRGWAVTFDHPDILTLVLPAELEPGPTDIVVGLLGRRKRGHDAEALDVVHVEDRRR